MRKLLILLVLLPTMLWAGGSGSLFVNNKNGLKSATKQFRYKGQTYIAKQMEGNKYCYYCEVGGRKFLYMHDAQIRFIQGTKSMTDLVIVLHGKANRIECGIHSCIGLEKGSLTIDSEDGFIGAIKINQTGDYRCIYTTAGGISFGRADITCNTNNVKKACISQEGAGKILSLDGTHLVTKSVGSKGTWIYARGGIKTRDCGFSDTFGVYWNASTGYLYKHRQGQDVQQYVNPEFVCNRSLHVTKDNKNYTVTSSYRLMNTAESEGASEREPLKQMDSGTALGGITSYHTSRSYSASFTIDGRLQECYRLESSGETVIDGAVYYCPTANAFVLSDGAWVNYGGWNLEIFRTRVAKLGIYVMGKATVSYYAGDNWIRLTNDAADVTLQGIINSRYPNAYLTIGNAGTGGREEFEIGFYRKLYINNMELQCNLKGGITFAALNPHDTEVKMTNADFKYDESVRFKGVQQFNTVGCGLSKTMLDRFPGLTFVKRNGEVFFSSSSNSVMPGPFHILSKNYKSELHCNWKQ